MMVSLNDATPTQRMFSIRQFNEIMLMGRSSSPNNLEHIKKRKSENSLIMRLVIGDMRRLNWVEFYGLNFFETMQLEYADYLEMVKVLEETNVSLENATDAVSKRLISKYEKSSRNK